MRRQNPDITEVQLDLRGDVNAALRPSGLPPSACQLIASYS